MGQCSRLGTRMGNNREKPVRAETDWTPWERTDFTCGWPPAYKGNGLDPGYWKIFIGMLVTPQICASLLPREK